MKTLGILLMALVVLGSPNASWSFSSAGSSWTSWTIFTESSMAYLEKTDKAVEKISVKPNPIVEIDNNLKSYTDLLKLFNEFKKFDVKFTTGLLNKIRGYDTLSGNELFLLRRTITTYYKINKKLLDFAKVYDFGKFKMSKTFAADEKNMPLIKAHLLWLSGHLLVLDHLGTMHNILYVSDTVLRRIVKNALRDKSNSIEGQNKTLSDIIRVNQYTVSIGESTKFIQQINLVRSIEEDLRDILANEESATMLVDEIIENPTAIEMGKGKIKFKIDNYTVSDSIAGAVTKLTGWLSAIFGNLAGAIKWRSGHLYNNPIALEVVHKKLKPMDVLLEKSPFILTDKFIPGYFGHVAVYLGTKEQLKAIGMWDHPGILPYQSQIAAGKVVLEAVRTGVRLNSIENFMNIDELTILRKENALSNKNLLIEEITRGMDQIGKAYDFNFDISTLDKIVCSELIYIFFGNVHWPTQYSFGRPTVTPDNIAEIIFHKNTKFQTINVMMSKIENQINYEDKDYLADVLDYELRRGDGTPVEDRTDPSNSYWKKETKCYTVGIGIFGKRACKTRYKEFYYEERDAI